MRFKVKLAGIVVGVAGLAAFCTGTLWWMSANLAIRSWSTPAKLIAASFLMMFIGLVVEDFTGD